MIWSPVATVAFLVFILSPYWLVMVSAWREGDRHFVWKFPLVVAAVGYGFMLVGSLLEHFK